MSTAFAAVTWEFRVSATPPWVLHWAGTIVDYPADNDKGFLSSLFRVRCSCGEDGLKQRYGTHLRPPCHFLGASFLTLHCLLACCPRSCTNTRAVVRGATRKFRRPSP